MEHSQKEQRPEKKYLLRCAAVEDWYAAEYTFPFTASLHRYATVGKMLHMMNAESPGCWFGLDYSEGMITCKGQHLCSETIPPAAWLNRIVTSLLDAVTHYEDDIEDIARFGFDIPDQFGFDSSGL